jgi:single-stranded-DNA-specific exonuclease
VVPLRGENRVLASFGLAALESAERPGLRELVRTALSGGEGRLDARKVGFRLGPRLNAAGRLGNAELALEVLTTRCPDEARRLVGRLERENERRKKIEDEIHRCARARVLEGCDLSREHAIVLGDTSWHPGVIGIVAARLCEEFHRPTFLVAINGERGRGSARSVHNVHISNALARCSAQLVGFGGHALAAGFEVERGKLDLLRAALNDSIDAPLSEMSPKDRFDGEVSLTDLTPQLLGELERLAPFGSGNPQPLFAARDLNVVGRTRRMGNDGRHLAFFVRGPRSSPSPVLRAVAFGCGSSCDDLQREGARVSLVFEPRWNHWQGRKEIELEVHDLRTEATEATEGAVTSASRGRCAAPQT